MMSEKQLEDAAQQLVEFQQSNTLSAILDGYSDLLASYRRLKSDFEEEREGRERYKQMARGQERNPFVLVLVDGDGYVFDDRFVAAGAEGGSQVAQLLNNTVKASLRRKGLEDCEIVVRVYANLVGLSKTLSRAGLCGPEKRSLAPFTSSFTRSYGLTDFTDAGELKENADFKLRAMLRLYADNAQCKHIYFAACHDVGYVSELTPYRGTRDRVTLVSTPGVLFHNEFKKLNLDIEEFPGVFRATALNGSSVYTRPAPNVQPSSTTPSEGQKICSFYPTGKCRYGKSCKNLHISSTTSPATPPNYSPFSGQFSRQPKIEDDFVNDFWRLGLGGSGSNGSGFISSVGGGGAGDSDGGRGGYRTSAMGVKDGRYSGRQSYGTGTPSTGTVQMGIDPASQLPKKADIPKGHVALNQNQQRLDAYIPNPSMAMTNELKERSKLRKFCNNKQLTGVCKTENCEYEHSPLPEALLPALEWLSRSVPCKRDQCRNAACVLGHVCQNQSCQHRGGKAFCKLHKTMHTIDLTFAGCVPGSSNHEAALQQLSESISEDEAEEWIPSLGSEL
ncbi:hypothetical protein GGR56DRAFT_612157 [Xylariaceae sp. FL0804]|nr:hypothetical protein GGR56DRAFT_612157 [Xylariaceae sp. FL0804]